MLRYGLMALHAVLLAGCVYLSYSGVAAFLAPPEVREVRIPAPEAVPPRHVAFAPYEIIGGRNLFESRETAPPSAPAPPPEELLEESRLQFQLLATIASPSPALSIATVLDQATRDHLHVRVGDVLGPTPDIKVARIEPRRLVIENKGRLEVLLMDEPEVTAKPSGSRVRKTPAGRAARKARSAARAKPARRRPSRTSPAAQRARIKQRIERLNRRTPTAAAAKSPAPAAAVAPLTLGATGSAQTLLEQVKISPALTNNGALEGITVAEVVAGTALANSGLQVGDVIVSVNGVPVSGPNELAQLPPATGSGQNCLDTVSADGQQRTHCWGR